jgi:hypothetical protein
MEVWLNAMRRKRLEMVAQRNRLWIQLRGTDRMLEEHDTKVEAMNRWEDEQGGNDSTPTRDQFQAMLMRMRFCLRCSQRFWDDAGSDCPYCWKESDDEDSAEWWESDSSEDEPFIEDALGGRLYTGRGKGNYTNVNQGKNGKKGSIIIKKGSVHLKGGKAVGKAPWHNKVKGKGKAKCNTRSSSSSYYKYG